MSAEYACVFGISSPLLQLLEGESIARFYDGMTVLTIQGKKGRIFWFVIKKLKEKYFYPNIPRFDDMDAEKICAQLYDTQVWKEVKFQQIWNSREVSSVVPLEENVFEHWHHGRVVCVGDSMHKVPLQGLMIGKPILSNLQMTPNIGQGANSAIESAAVLANNLNDMIRRRGIKAPTTKQLESSLKAFADSRLPRAKDTVKSAGFLTRLQARDGIGLRFLGRYIVPFAGDFPADQASSVVRAAPQLDYLPLPGRGGDYWGQRQWQALLWIGWVKQVALFMLRHFT
ncbi:MAG: hypothetical protein Q9228_006546, partial [Teloschistes exilis]